MSQRPPFPPIPSSMEGSSRSDGMQMNPPSTGFPTQQGIRPGPPQPFQPQASRFPPGQFPNFRPPTQPPSNGTMHPPPPIFRPPTPQPGSFQPPRPQASFQAPVPGALRPPMPGQGSFQPPAPGQNNLQGPPPGQFSTQAPYPGQSMQRPVSRTGQPSSPRIDPNQIPRPTEKESDPVIHFETRLNGQHQIPPAASSRYIGKDVGNCDPKFVRLSLNQLPATAELTTNAALPLVAFIQPLALQKPEEAPISVVDFGETGPVRCGRCRAYMNPFMLFQDGGRSFICCFCNFRNETPANYFCYLGADGQRRDLHERPELSMGTVEYAAPAAFMARPPMPPVHFFLIDSTFAAVSSGALHTICSSIKMVLDSIQGADRALIGIATYDSVVQFYHVKEEGGPRILIMSDITEVFAPLPSLLMSLQHQRDSIEEILDLIPSLYKDQKNGESCAGAAIESAIEALKPTGGKLHVMLGIRPSQGSRALKPREPQIPNSGEKAEAEKQTILLPQDNTYRTLATNASEFFICVDLFFFTHNYVDISTLSVLSTLTGGSIYKYDNFTPRNSAQQFLNDLRWNLTRPQGFEAVMRVRSSAGLEIESYLGAIHVRNQHEIDLAGIDCDKAIMVKLLHDDKLQDEGQAFIQSALLYTTTSGQRRIRVSTLGVPVTSDVVKVFRGADLECNLNYLARKISAMLPGSSLQVGKDLIVNGCTNILAAYRKYAAHSSSSGQLILPDSMKLLPMYGLGLMKSPALAPETKPDERAACLAHFLSLPCSKITRLVYGRFFELDEILEQKEVQIPDSLWLTSEKLQEKKLYLFENGQEMIIKVESQVPPETLKALFGIDQINVKGPEPTVIHSEHPLNAKLHKLLNELRMREGCYMSLRVALRSTAQDSRFLHCLVEDRNTHGPSYVQFLCTVHRMIQQKLS